MPSDQSIPDPSQPVPDQFDLVCEGCGYSLVGLTTDRCPECGRAFDPTELPLARIPWLFRKRYGPVRAYLMTVWMLLAHPLNFAREVSRPVRISADDAKRFRKLTIRIALGSVWLWGLLILTLIAFDEAQRAGSVRFQAWELVQMSVFMVAAIVAAWLFFWLATDLPTFIWKGLAASPRDLAPLHHYAIAPLGLLPVIAASAAFCTALSIYNHDVDRGIEIITLIGGFSIVAVAAMTWLIAPLLMRGATRCPIWRQMLLAAYLPVHWAVIAILSLLVLGLGMSLVAGNF